MLVQSCIQETDSLGLGILLVAMGRRALGMYLKPGFGILDEKSQSLEPYGADELYETFFLVRRVGRSL